MATRALFEGLVVDEHDRPVEVRYVGNEACYVVDDHGFLRHIPSEQVDRQVLAFFKAQIEGHEDLLAEQTARMLGQDDIFTRAVLLKQFENLDQHLETLFQTGIPEEGRAYMGMLGFRIRINLHGEVLDIQQPGLSSDEE